MTGLEDAARQFVGVLESLRIPYAIMGGLAVRVHALPRPTFDVDFTVSLPRESLGRLYEEAEKLGFTVPDSQLGGWVDQVHGLPVVKVQLNLSDRIIDLDVFLAETPYQRELLQRRRRYSAEGWDGWFVTPEDLILLKLLADRPKGRADIVDILFVQTVLDEPYLTEWAARLGVSTQLAAALSDRTPG
ncbi:MAG: hypothetical protein JNG90_02755 [Planctomycetaceae bacterium]|nr:hypothetical protein [Planctomycetaceae bacterium]